MRITYVEANGDEHVVDVPVGLSVMRGAVDNNLPSILADCGGNCTCGTCRVYVDANWRAVTGQPSEDEAAVLEIEDDPLSGLRLSCQIKVAPGFDGLVVRLPERQF